MGAEGATEKRAVLETVLPELGDSWYPLGAPGWRGLSPVWAAEAACRRPRNRGLADT